MKEWDRPSLGGMPLWSVLQRRSLLVLHEPRLRNWSATRSATSDGLDSPGWLGPGESR